MVHLDVPATARVAVLVNRGGLWRIFYQASVRATSDQGQPVKFTKISSQALDEDPSGETHADDVISHVEGQLLAAGYDVTRSPEVSEPMIVATWALRPRAVHNARSA